MFNGNGLTHTHFSIQACMHASDRPNIVYASEIVLSKLWPKSQSLSRMGRNWQIDISTVRILSLTHSHTIHLSQCSVPFRCRLPKYRKFSVHSKFFVWKFNLNFYPNATYTSLCSFKANVHTVDFFSLFFSIYFVLFNMNTKTKSKDTNQKIEVNRAIVRNLLKIPVGISKAMGEGGRWRQGRIYMRIKLVYWYKWAEIRKLNDFKFNMCVFYRTHTHIQKFSEENIW